MKYKQFLAVTLLTFAFFSCSKEKTTTTGGTNQPPVSYSALEITSVKITAMPFTDPSGDTWDNSAPLDNPWPDLYFTFNDQNNSYATLFTSNTVFNVTPTQIPYTWTLSSPYEVPNFNGTYAITLWDDDSNVSLTNSHSGDDIIDGINNLSPANLVAAGYPATDNIISTDGKLLITLGLHWHN
jgi:hypothetical protein